MKTWLLGAVIASSPVVGLPAEVPPVTLRECWVRALENDPTIQRQRAEVERAAGVQQTYRSRALPRLGIRSPAGLAAGDLYGDGGPYATVKAELSQPLLDVGLPAAWRRGGLEVIIAQQNLQRTIDEQLMQVRQAYLHAALSRQLLELTRQVQGQLEANVKSAQQRLVVGLASQHDVKQAEVQWLALQPEVARLEHEDQDARVELAERTGRDLAARLPAPVDRLEPKPLRFDLAAETQRALAQRADVLLLRALLQAVDADSQMVAAGYFPLITLVAFSQYVPEAKILTQRPAVVPGQESRSTESRYGAALTWQVIDNGRVTGARQRLEGGRQAYAIILRQLEENVARSLAVLRDAAESAAARLAALEQSRRQAEELLTLVRSRVELGQATQLDFLNAQSNLLAIQRGVWQAIYEMEVAHVQFDRLTGRPVRFELPTDRAEP